MNANADPAADPRLDALDAAAVGLLEPLIVGMPFETGAAQGAGGFASDATNDAGAQAAAAGDWRARLAQALDRLSLAALPLELAGLAQTATLLAEWLRTPRPDGEGAPADAAAGVLRDGETALELALAEGWVGDAIAFCSGELGSDESASLVGRLRDWPGIDAQLTPERASALAMRLRADAQRIAQATRASLPAQASASAAAAADPGPSPQPEARGGLPAPSAHDASLAIGSDELQMLAEAAEQLDEEFRDALAAGPDFESFARIGDAIERYASAIAYVGLVPVSDALFAWHRNLACLARETHRFGQAHRDLLARLPSLWAALFEAPSSDAAGAALAPLADAAWPVSVDPTTLDAARRAFASIVRVGTRRVSAPEAEPDDEAMSLEIPPDADREVVDNLLRELPALSAAFSAAIERARAGSREDLAQGQRIAHTLKGSANTVGVRAIASLTHRLEDLLQLLDGADGERLAPDLADVLSDAADCLAEMSEAVAGLGDPPARARDVHRSVGQWIVRLLQVSASGQYVQPAAPHEEGGAQGQTTLPPPDDAPMSAPPQAAFGHTDGAAAAREPVAAAPEPAAATPETAAATPETAAATPETAAATPETAAAAPETAAAAPEVGAVARGDDDERPHEPGAGAAAQEWLRVPASLIERLLAFANEASILLSQAQEQAVEVDRVRATLVGGTDQLQDLSSELERLVDLRGSMLSERRERDDFDPLELDEHSDLQMVSRRIAESGADGRLIEQQLGRNVAALRDSLSRLERLQVDLREAALQTRTVRVESMVPRWARTVRQAARMAMREATLRVQGEDVEVDAQLLQALVEPIGHLLRNAVDHGIEPPDERERLGKPRAGCVSLHFSRDGGDLLIECSDDGRGLDLPAIRSRAVALGLIAPDESPSDSALARLAFVQGFSTRERATQLSGRGIGLEVVERIAREHRGTVAIDTQRGVATRVRLRLPVRLAAMPVVVVRSATYVIGLSVRDVERIVSADAGVAADASDAGDAGDAGVAMRIVRIEDVLGLPEDAFAPEPGGEARTKVVLQVRMPDGESIGIRVPEPGQPRNVVLRPLASFVGEIPGFEGATVLGDGAVAPVYDLPRLLAQRRAGRAAPALHAARAALPVCLVVDDSVSVRRMMEQFVRDLGYEPDSAGDGVEALERVRRRIPSIVLVDLEMPRMNGVEFVRALRAQEATRDVPVVMITSRSSEKHRALAHDAGVDVFLTKPYTEDALASHITALLQSRGARR
ncbi:MAG: response regulator [Burkholderiaceae bacterium]|nr:response regulator [Burkholderiaceae bacterium]